MDVHVDGGCWLLDMSLIVAPLFVATALLISPLLVGCLAVVPIRIRISVGCFGLLLFFFCGGGAAAGQGGMTIVVGCPRRRSRIMRRFEIFTRSCRSSIVLHAIVMVRRGCRGFPAPTSNAFAKCQPHGAVGDFPSVVHQANHDCTHAEVKHGSNAQRQKNRFPSVHAFRYGIRVGRSIMCGCWWNW